MIAIYLLYKYITYSCYNNIIIVHVIIIINIIYSCSCDSEEKMNKGNLIKL